MQKLMCAWGFSLGVLGGCGGSGAPSSPALSSAGGSAADAGGGATSRDAGVDATSGSSSGASGAPVDAFWSQSAAVPGDSDPRALFIASDAFYAVQVGVPGSLTRSATHDGGRTWKAVTTQFITTKADPTLWLLGLGADGALLARWTRPASCSNCTSDAPGTDNDSFLVRWDDAAMLWSVVDTIPAATVEMAGTTEPSRQHLVTGGGHTWLWSSVIVRSDALGSGSWVPVPSPSAGQVRALEAATDGTLYAIADPQTGHGDALYVLPEGGAWQTVTAPIGGGGWPASMDEVAIGVEGQVYALVAGTHVRRLDGATWTEITPPELLQAAATTGERWRLVASAAGELLVATPKNGQTSVFLSRDHGDSWHEHTGAVTNLLTDIAFSPTSRPYACARGGGRTYVWSGATPDAW